MAYTHQKRLENWVRRQVFGPDWGSKVEKFVVRHIPATGKGTVVFEKKMDGTLTITDDDIPQLTEDLYQALLDDVAGMGNTQRYAVEAWREDRDTHSGRYTCQMVAEDDSDNSVDALDTEGPTAKGLQSQLMRHNEAIMKTAMAGFGTIINSLQRVNAQQGEQISMLIEKSYKNMEVVEAALTQQSQREIAEMTAASEQDRKDKIIEKLMGLAPAVVQKMTGMNVLQLVSGKPGEAAPDPGDMAFKAMIKDMTPEEFQGVLAALKPERQMALIHYAQKLAEEAKQEDARKSEKKASA